MSTFEDDDSLILEGIVVTVDASGDFNVAPMGPRVDRQQSKLVLRPYTPAQTYRNLKATRCGVLHVTDDVLLIAKAAIGIVDPPPALTSIEDFPCPRLSDTCRWMAFRVRSLDDSSERTTIACDIVGQGHERPFFGFNRAKHAVLEAAILATRIGILPGNDIRAEMARLHTPIQKTAGRQERQAFDLLDEFITARLNPEP